MRITKRDLNRIIREEYTIVERKSQRRVLARKTRSRKPLTEIERAQKQLMIERVARDFSREILEEGFFGKLFNRLLSGTMVVGKKMGQKMQKIGKAASAGWNDFMKEVDATTENRMKKSVAELKELEKDPAGNKAKIAEKKAEVKDIKEEGEITKKAADLYQEKLKKFNASMVEDLMKILMSDPAEMEADQAKETAGTIVGVGSPATTGI